MKKISKITLENFRAFSGKTEINFNNSNDKSADFVCIYGKNGFGKTSLFDGFEWFFTGEIHLLEKELQSNVSRYEGAVLKNRFVSSSESAGISVEFSDGKQGHRTVVKKNNSKNDYGKGMPSGEYKGMVNFGIRIAVNVIFLKLFIVYTKKLRLQMKSVMINCVHYLRKYLNWIWNQK